MSRQIVYVLVNPAMPGLTKIGKTTQDDLSWRLSQLYSTGVPVPFDCIYACEVEDCHDVERALHTAFGDHRVNPNREFFEIAPERVVAILRLLATTEITHEVSRQLSEGTTDDDRQSGERMKVTRRPRLDFEEMGIPIGAMIEFVDGPSVQAKVIDRRKVEYDSQTYSLSALTSKLLNLDYAVGPTPHWTYQGRSLWDIYNETHLLEE